MSRQIDMTKPESWTDEDRAYLESRGVQHPELNRPVAGFAPAVEALPDEVQRLKDFLEKHFPAELGGEAETPVSAAIRLLETADGYQDTEQGDDSGDDYDSWKLSELRTEAETREGLADQSKAKKPEVIAALRQWDAEHPDTEQ